MTEKEWLAKEQELQAQAFRMLRNALANPDIVGLKTVKDVYTFLKGQEESIYNVIGDCPKE